MATYLYSMQGLNDYEKNSSICELEFGKGKMPLYIWKKDIDKFLRTVVPVESKNIEEYVNRAVEGINNGDYSYVNTLISSRGMIIESDFRNELEYFNGATNGKISIRSMKMNGEMTNPFPYSDKRPRFEELYPESN